MPGFMGNLYLNLCTALRTESHGASGLQGFPTAGVSARPGSVNLVLQPTLRLATGETMRIGGWTCIGIVVSLLYGIRVAVVVADWSARF